jgi:regulator of sigma E protease
MRAQLTQVPRTVRDEYGSNQELLVFGATNNFERGRGEMTSIEGRLGYAVTRAVERTGETVGVMASGFWSVLRGRSPSEELGGPITMFRVASVSGSKGWEAFLLMIALVSVSVGLINLLPIPVLDGGHILVFAIEAVRRRPLSVRTRDRINVGGLAIVGLISVLALSNDVVRFILN